MLESLLGITNDSSITTITTITCMLFAVILGIIIAASYAIITKKEEISLSFFLTLVIMPAAVALVIVLVGSNLARALSLGGIFALVRFRSMPGDGKDISFVFVAMAAGLSSGLGFLTIALAATVVLALVVVVVTKVAGLVFANNTQSLKIVIPEDMDYGDAFKDIFEKYTDKAELEKVKTTNMGTLYELAYFVNMKSDADEKKFLDEIRTRNGNLSVILAKHLKKKEEL
ncbi:MAG: DUF4956 domain-containing protein [Lachnospiraceae bacterium]|nr:DUF4956 domain-containing protein [Lachnospiraceae bacterium]